uniref:Putative ovule protein n=1 Tax=Solanum chacoense TaxID=4108 RepID=A0A0V0HZH3_SOLCH
MIPNCGLITPSLVVLVSDSTLVFFYSLDVFFALEIPPCPPPSVLLFPLLVFPLYKFFIYTITWYLPFLLCSPLRFLRIQLRVQCITFTLNYVLAIDN